MKLINIGVITRNEAREVIQFMKLEDENMDRLTVQSDIMSLEEALDNDFNIEDSMPNDKKQV